MRCITPFRGGERSMRYMAESKMSQGDVLDRALEYFTSVSGGLMVSSKDAGSLCLESPLGFVTLTTCPSEKKGKKTTVEIETMEFDLQVREFLEKLR